MKAKELTLPMQTKRSIEAANGKGSLDQMLSWSIQSFGEKEEEW